jgi:hypothetical protein
MLKIRKLYFLNKSFQYFKGLSRIRDFNFFRTTSVLQIYPS